ncbi:MAG: phosphoribulokinase, partial [Thiobacillus sp.]
DLGIGVVPIVNLEWIQKIHRDGAERGYSADVIVDTILRRMPDESFIVIRFRNPDGVDFPCLLNMIPNAFMSRRNTLVVPGAKMGFAMELILAPLIQDMIAGKRK